MRVRKPPASTAHAWLSGGGSESSAGRWQDACEEGRAWLAWEGSRACMHGSSPISETEAGHTALIPGPSSTLKRSAYQLQGGSDEREGRVGNSH
jgi:hypothetical protein